MAPIRYPIHVQSGGDGTVLVTFPDFPGVTVSGQRADARSAAADALESIIAARLTERRPIPLPSTIDDSLLAVAVDRREDIDAHNAALRMMERHRGALQGLAER